MDWIWLRIGTGGELLRMRQWTFGLHNMRWTSWLGGDLLASQEGLWFIHSFIHSIGMCRMRRFLAVLRSFFYSSLLCTFSCHPSPPTSLPYSLTSSCHLFLGLPLNLVVPRFIYNTLLGILFSSILCTCRNQHNLYNLIAPIIVWDFF